MIETTYNCYLRNDGILKVVAEVSTYGFKPEGTKEDWINFAKEKAIKNNIKRIALYAESQDKQTGYTSDNFILEVDVDSL